ncbi:hypothetical protein JZU71_03730, partial [bacterium]|nr:hypothetical protein [bacterium]
QYTTSIDNLSGVVAGAGGGGGSGVGMTINQYNEVFGWQGVGVVYGGGGGAGAGNGSAATAGSGGTYVWINPYDLYGGTGGSGGVLGSSGGWGGSPSWAGSGDGGYQIGGYNGGSTPGAAGACTSGNSFITWTVAGTRYGALN